MNNTVKMLIMKYSGNDNKKYILSDQLRFVFTTVRYTVVATKAIYTAALTDHSVYRISLITCHRVLELISGTSEYFTSLKN